MAKPRLFLALAVVLCLAAALTADQATAAEDPVTVTVVPFSSADVGQHSWLGKAIADILTRQLAQVPDVTVLERERVQTFLDELELQESGFFTQEDAGRVGRVARVDQVIYGNFGLRHDRLEINLILVDLATQNALQRGRVSGPLESLHELAAQLSLDLLAGRGVVLSAEDSAAVRFAPTDSLPAIQYFYQALDHLDHGRNEDAFGAFYRATKQDPDYREAQLWMGRALEFLGFDDLAVIAFDALARRPGRQAETYDALMFMARLLEDRDVDHAISTYRGLVDVRPAVPHSLEAAYRLAGLLEREEDYAGAYRALAFIDGFRELEAQNQNAFAGAQRRQAEPSHTGMAEIANYLKALFSDRQAQQAGAVLQPFYISQSGIRQSRFFDWPHALDLYREAIVRMAGLYPKLPPNRETGERPDAPRGVFVVDPANPVITERRFRSTPSLFHEERYTENWLEAFYAVVIPEGYVATGAELRVSGRQLNDWGDHSFAMRLLPFPLPRNYQNAWLGVIYGQTPSYKTLNKRIYFHGRHRGMLALQFIENFSEIRDWQIKLVLKPLEAVAVTTASPARQGTAFREGQRVGQIVEGEGPGPGVTLPLFRYLEHPRKSLALAERSGEGPYLVTARGTIGGEATDLWLSRGDRQSHWSAPKIMPLNAASEDYAPQLVRAEDGGLRLFWLSDRRGRGWEIWTSSLPPGEHAAWSDPVRVPLERFAATGLEGAGDLAENLLHYTVIQDRRGRWVLGYYSHEAGRLVFLMSPDALNWEMTGGPNVAQVLYNLVLTEDRAGVYRAGAVRADGALHLWRSNDLSNWAVRRVAVESPAALRRARHYPARLFAEPNGDLLLLHSEAVYGLQYSRLHPDTGKAIPDLVKDAGLEAFAATVLEDGAYLVALQQSDRIDLRRYHRFQAAGPKADLRSSPLYTEIETDSEGNRWHRTFARIRFTLPDVTAVAVEPDGREWWGIESGVFSRKGTDYFVRFVAQGFLFHAVSDILPCGPAVYFASRHLDEPRIGIAHPRSSGGRTIYKLEAKRIEDAEGRITALACDKDRTLLVGTSGGDLIALTGDRVDARFRLENGEAPSAVTAHPREAAAYFGTDRGRLFRLAGDFQEIEVTPAAGQPVQGIAIDRQDRLWLAIEKKGLYLRRDTRWEDRSPSLPGLPYFSVTDMIADPAQGLWLLTNPEFASPGLGYFDGTAIRFLNPPHLPLATPVDLAVAADGTVRVGTALDGFYKLERSAP